jgi:hypothetical protein
MAAPAWVKSRDVSFLEDTVDDRAGQLQSKRKEASKISIPLVIGLSIGIFIALFAGLIVLFGGLSFSIGDFSLGTNAFTGTAAVGGALQFALIVAASGGIIPGIAYALFRDREIQRKNEELAALGLEIKYLRSKILTLKQEEIASRFDKGGGAAAGSGSGRTGGGPGSPTADKTLPKGWRPAARS